MACCLFDQIFTFIHVGWEGNAHDITVWRDALTNSKYVFPHPPLGYPNTVGYLSPIRMIGVRYHIPEYKKRLPKGMLEHFNYRHLSLKMSIECAFGLLKKR